MCPWAQEPQEVSAKLDRGQKHPVEMGPQVPHPTAASQRLSSASQGHCSSPILYKKPSTKCSTDFIALGLADRGIWVGIWGQWQCWGDEAGGLVAGQGQQHGGGHTVKHGQAFCQLQQQVLHLLSLA